MLYLLLSLVAVLASAENDVQRRLSFVPNLQLEKDLLDNIAWRVAYGAYQGVEAFLNPNRRLEDSETEIMDVIAKVTDDIPRRRIICGGLCIAIAAAVAGGVAAGATQGVIHAVTNSVEADALNVVVPAMTRTQIDQYATIAAQGAFDAVETTFGISGIEAFGDQLAQILSVPQRRIVCGGICIAVATAVGAGAVGGLVEGLIGLASNSVGAEALNIDTSLFLTPAQQAQFGEVERMVIDTITAIGTDGAIKALGGLGA